MKYKQYDTMVLIGNRVSKYMSEKSKINSQNVICFLEYPMAYHFIVEPLKQPKTKFTFLS